MLRAKTPGRGLPGRLMPGIFLFGAPPTTPAEIETDAAEHWPKPAHKVNPRHLRIGRNLPETVGVARFGSRRQGEGPSMRLPGPYGKVPPLRSPHFDQEWPPLPMAPVPAPSAARLTPPGNPGR